MQSVHVDNFKLDEDSNMIIYQAYEFSKGSLLECFADPEEAVGAANMLADTLIENFPKRLQTNKGRQALSW
jgi:hypothetical protein